MAIKTRQSNKNKIYKFSLNGDSETDDLANALQSAPTSDEASDERVIEQNRGSIPREEKRREEKRREEKRREEKLHAHYQVGRFSQVAYIGFHGGEMRGTQIRKLTSSLAFLSGSRKKKDRW
jgi:hypothetical protein